MPRMDYKWCKACHRHVTEAGVLSHTRLCSDCAAAKLTENVLGLALHQGEPLLRWRRGMIRSAGGLLPTELLKTP